MKNDFKAIIEWDEGWYIALCDQVPGANGQGRTVVEALESLDNAIALILEYRRK